MFTRNVKMNANDKVELRKEILKVTPDVVAPKKVKQAPAPKVSKKAEALLTVLKTFPRDWQPGQTSKGEALRKAFETILGETLVVTAPVDNSMSSAPRIDKGNLKKFQAFVPESDQSHHDCPINKVVLLIQDGGNQVMMENGKVGTVTRSFCRYATRPEINAFLDKLQKTANVEEVARIFDGR
jgi:hypothetical protein